MSSQIGNTLAKRRTQKLENLHYYVLGTLFPLPVHLDDQRGEFLESWMAYQEFDEFPDLIEYYTTIGNGTLLKEEYTTIKDSTLLKDIEHFLYLTQSYFSDDTPNQILHLMSTLIVWSKTFYTTTGQYPTLYDYLAIMREDLIRWEYHLDNPNISVRPNIFRFTLIPPLVYCGEVSHHMRDSIETYESSVGHTTNMTCPSVCQSHQLSICHTTNMTRPYVCQSRQLSDHRTVDTTGPSVCQPHESPVRHTTTATCQSVCQAYPSPVHHTIMMTSPSVRQSYSTSDHHTNTTTSPSVCQSRQSSVRRTVEPTSLSVCQPHITSVRHAMDSNSPSVCQPHDTSIRHTNITRSPSVCPSKQSSDHHTTSKTSPSICQSRIPSVCHNVIPTSSSVCQSRDSSVCYPPRDTRHAVCSSSVTSVLPSANPTVKIPAYRNPFPYYHGTGKVPFVHTSTESSVNHSDSPSVNSSPFAAIPSKLPGNYGENSTVNYLHETPVKSPTVSTSYNTSVVAPVRATYVPFVCASSVQPVRTSCVTSVIAPVCASSVPSVLPYGNERQEFPAGYPGTNYGEKNPSEITAKIPYDVTLTLQQAKFPEKTPDTTNRVKYPGNFLLTLIRVKFTVINLRNYVLGGFHVASRTMRCAHGSIIKILMEWDPGPTYDVQRLWDPGGPTYSSISSVPTNLDKLGKPKSYLDYIHLPGLSPLTFLVAIKPILASSTNLKKARPYGELQVPT